MPRHAIIIGSMKCGTTSMFRYLIQHPEISGSNPKEPQFFSDPKKYSLGMDSYLTYWKDKNSSILLEGSPNYTKYPAFSGAPEAINSYDIHPLFIYLVRNPFDRIISHYNHKVRANDPCDILDKHLINTSDYYLQLEQYKPFFPAENIMVVDFDEFRNRTDVVVNKIFEFLGLNTCKVNTAKVHHKTKRNILSHYYRKIVKGNDLKLKSELTAEERAHITQLLRPNMLKFGKEYNIDTGKWGF